MKKNKLFALVDCNNFYASCERLFRPELNGKPVVVLSNNDGCIIARSNEAKTLGIKMAEPYFKVKAFLRRHRVHVFSSNYALYGDLSQRVMSTLRALEPDVEIYSIDEAFVRLPYMDRASAEKYARVIRQRVRQNTGISVSVGIAGTKTLAKAANYVAKKDSFFDGVFGVESSAEIEKMLISLDVGDVWGVGRKSAEKLANCGVKNALAFSRLSDQWLRRNLTVTGLRTATELRGVSCITLGKAPLSRKSVLCSRSFKHPVRSLPDLKEAVATYVSTAAEKLRSQKLAACCLNVFLRTSPHQKNRAQYSNHYTVPLAEPTSHNRPLIRAAMLGIEEIYRSGYQFQKTGVMLTGLVADNCRQQNLFALADDDSLMTAFDQINTRWGKDTLQYAVAGLSKPWSMQQSCKSPAYTTRWQDLPVVGQVEREKKIIPYRNE